MISLKAPHNNLMPYTQQSILNTVKNNQLPEDIKSSLVSCVDIFKVLIKQYYDYPYDCRDDLVDDDKLIHLMAAVRDCEWSDDNWICPYISRHLLSLNPLLACCRRYSRGER